MACAVLVKFAKSIGGQFLGQCRIPDETKQRSHQTRVMFDEKVLEDWIPTRPARFDRGTGP